ncbi:hypothetical protein DAEQUDRAFT_102843 [Daedalea quercina L-15889]|uniref:Uncharacterized protein n=1 Tax=Daedalea quercina L-15889 TaxID=1314783 RepID=A0A165KUM4_9APHY|nr:hypothetical protein DAEQUDRAFT_102843 [Daedalea quercina L-15889]
MMLCSDALFHVANGGFMALRTYAISSRTMTFSSLIILLSLVPVVLDIYLIHTLDAVRIQQPDMSVICVIAPNISGDFLRTVLITNQVSSLSAEMFLVWAIWRHASAVKIAGGAQIGLRLTATLLRDGTVYFVTILPSSYRASNTCTTTRH